MSFKYTPNALKKIEQIFDEAKYIVRYEKGNFASGYCVLEHRKVVVINKFLNIEGRTNALIEILPSIKVDFNTLSGESQKLIHQLNITLQAPEVAPEAETDEISEIKEDTELEQNDSKDETIKTEVVVNKQEATEESVTSEDAQNDIIVKTDEFNDSSEK